MATKVLSIEIGQGLTRVVEMDYKAKNPKIYNSFTFETPQDVVNDGLVNRNDAFASVLKSECAKRDIKTNSVVFTVTSTRIARRDAKIPMVKDRQIQEVINANATDFFPVDMSQYRLAYDVQERINTAEEKQIRLNLLAVPNDIISSYYGLAELCGMTLVGLDYAGNSVYQVVKESFKEGVNIVIKLDEKNGLVTVVKDGKLDFQRAVTYGIDDAIEAVRKNTVFGTNLTYAEAIEVLCGKTCIRRVLNPEEGYKEKEDTDQIITEARKEVTESLRYMIGMVGRVLEYYVSHNEDVQINDIALIGLGADFSGLSKLMTNELNHKVRVFQNEQNEAVSKTTSGENLSVSCYAACIGAATDPVNLIQESAKAGKKGFTLSTDALSKYNGLEILLVLVILAVLIGGIGIFKDLSTKSEQEQLNARIEELKEAEEVYNKYVQTKSNYDDFISKYAMTVTPNTELYNFIGELEDKMPSSIRMISFTADGTSVTMSMKVDTKVEAADLLVQLRTFESLATVDSSGITEEVGEDGTTAVTLTVNCTYAAPAALN